jgi:mannose-1-phosphate guanylyltransferase
MHLPLRRQGKAWVTSKTAFAKLPSSSIDYAVVEKASNLLVLRGDFTWADVGHWRTIYDILVPSKSANVVRGHYLGVASQGNLVYSLGGRLIATVGMHDTIIIDTGDALLVCPKERAQEVRIIVSELARLGLQRYL